MANHTSMAGQAGVWRSPNAEKLRIARDFRRRPTPAELVLWSRLRGRRCGGLKFRRQHVIAGFIADFYCPEAQVIVEVDGPVHDKQAAADAERDAVFTKYGILVLRFSNAQVLADAGDAVVEAILQALAPRLPRDRQPPH